MPKERSTVNGGRTKGTGQMHGAMTLLVACIACNTVVGKIALFMYPPGLLKRTSKFHRGVGPPTKSYPYYAPTFLDLARLAPPKVGAHG
ncbi:hypothetical protein NEUTE2DRAFT_71834 [Neurospora tetrasperma FGSC 2509]|nr:hypothetical protein NEUTE2DRAFT_71834 [Neurospora tetrasperma FGSC 2509]